MLRFFRKYNKHILVVGVTLLMIAFLIQPTLSMFGPDPAGEPVGTIGSDTITVADQRRSGGQLRVLGQLSGSLVNLSASRVGQVPTPLEWLLMVREARSMGLEASEGEVDQLLSDMGGDLAKLDAAGRAMGMSITAVRAAMKDWIVVQSYKELINGLVHRPVGQRLRHYDTARQFLRFGYIQGAAVELESALQGAPRLSAPMLKRFFHEHQARVQATVVIIPCDRMLSDISQPDEQALIELFEQYRQSLPGEGRPFGFGYRTPNRVKIEYLTVPLDRVHEKVFIDEADALGFYDSHPDQFMVEPAEPTDTSGPRQVRPYQEVRGQILERLRQEHAQRLADRIVKTAQAALLEDARHLEERAGYRTIPDGWKPLGLEPVAQRLGQEFGVLPDVRRIDDRWLDRDQLARLPGIGRASVDRGGRSEPFVDYVLSARALLGTDGQHPLRSLALQALMPSVPLASPDGGVHLFRLIEVQPSRVPDTIDEVRDQVARDARRVRAYELLKQQSQTLLEQAQADGLQEWASRQGLMAKQLPPLPKRVPGYGGVLLAPDVPALGRSEAFVDGVFDLADRVVQASAGQQGESFTAGDLQAVPPAQRTTAIAVDGVLSIALVRIDGLLPMRRSDFQAMVAAPQVGAWVNQSLTGSSRQESLSLEALSYRLGFEWAHGTEPDENTADDPSLGPTARP